MPSWLRRLLGNELGQDVTEYTLIVGFIATIGIAVYASAGGSINSVWTTASGITSNAGLTAAGVSGPP
ncbi:MAG TPA: hypothetical protein VG297_17795 [Bryobacteraceae bacterium]|jgi:Flp pilus assembly pilin Flp|nr:hypothetical protein [Bryobacteraceae bacterium]